MASLLIPDIRDNLKKRLSQRAKAHGRSLEDEAREILNETLGEKTEENETLGGLVAELFGPDHGIDLEAYLPEREEMREIPGFANDRS